ncbi:MAG: NAD(P)-binding protein [Chitinivibrionales bacterium]|nr:NAD(P)-binding protein [Chitinivibrionales bacterium]
MNNAYDAVIIGAGIGGLTCGAFLARAGKRVLVLEQHTRIGGYAHQFKRKKFRFDSGIHSVPLADDGMIMHLLKLLEVDHLISPVSLDAMYRLITPEISFTVPSDSHRIVDALYRRFPHRHAEIDALLSDMRRFYDVLARPIFDFEFCYREEDITFLRRYHNLSYEEYIKNFISDPLLRQVFYAMWPYGGTPPDYAPAVFYAMMFVIHFLEGSHYADGSFAKLAAALASAITTRGGEVRTRSRVASIAVENGSARSVLTVNGEEFVTHLVVSNISPYNLHFEMLGPRNQRKLIKKRLANLRPSVSSLGVYLGLSEDVTQRLDGNNITFWFKTGKHADIYGNIRAGKSGVIDHLCLLTAASKETQPTLTLLTLAEQEASTNWKREKQLVAEKMLDRADTIIPGLRSLVDLIEIGSPDTFERYTGNTAGALYGFENTREMYGEAKLPKTTHIKNLYQTGHWGTPGGGVWNVMYNAYATSKIILDRSGPALGNKKKPVVGSISHNMKIRLIYPRFKKFLEGHAELDEVVREHLVGNYTMPPSLGLPVLAACTPGEIELRLTDDNIGDPIDFDEKVDLVAISCFTPQGRRAYDIGDAFRSRGVKVILGGIHPTGIPHEALQHADAVCVGEVEPVWDQILADLKSGNLKKLYQAPDNYDLASMPIPDRSIFASDKYTWNAHIVLTTRGCPVRCDMCPVPNKEGPTLRFRPVDEVVRDIQSMPYKEFYFADDTIMIPGKRCEKYLFKLMERTSELDVSIFMASTMMMRPDPQLYKTLAAGGATSMYTVWGFDRISRRLLSPDCTRQEWQAGIDLVHMNGDAGIHYFASFGIGFDDHDEGVFDRILQFCEDAGVDLAEFYINTPFPGTPFGSLAEKQNRIYHRDYTFWNTGNVVFEPAKMSANRLLEGFYYLWKNFYKNKKPVQTIRSFDVNEQSAAY